VNGKEEMIVDAKKWVAAEEETLEAEDKILAEEEEQEEILVEAEGEKQAIEVEEEVVVEVAEEEAALGEPEGEGEEETTVGEEGTTLAVDSFLRITFIRKTNPL